MSQIKPMRCVKQHTSHAHTHAEHRSQTQLYFKHINKLVLEIFGGKANLNDQIF